MRLGEVEVRRRRRREERCRRMTVEKREVRKR